MLTDAILARSRSQNGLRLATLLVLVAILLAGTFLRVNDLASLPPGLYHDEAYSGLDALGILRGADLPIFFEGNGGREPFFIYLHALSIWALGPSPFALRIPAAFVGILTLPVFFVLLRALAADRTRSLPTSMIGTAALATLYWHLNFSRVGWRTISLPLFACLAFYFFWRARRTARTRDNVLAGVFLGLSLYTYLAARFLPVVIAAYWLLEFVALVRLRGKFGTWARNSLLVVGAAVVAFSPLSLYFLSHPQALLFRVGDVTLGGNGNTVQSIVDNVQRVASIFYANGDTEWRHGIARRPVLDWVTGIPFAVGLSATAYRWRRPESWFAFLWFGIMLLPTILSKDAPDTQRAIGAAPAVCVFVAWGMEQLVVWISGRVGVTRHALAFAATALVLVVGGAISFRDYFVTWANNSHAYYDFQGDLAGLARWMNAQHSDLLVPMELYSEPTIQFLLQSRYGQVRTDLEATPSGDALAVVPSTAPAGAFALLRGNTSTLIRPDSSLADTLANQRGESLTDRWGRLTARIVKLPTQRPQTQSALAMTPLGVNFGDRVDLVGYSFDDNFITPGKPFAVTLYWSSRRAGLPEVIVFAHLLDVAGNAVAGVDEVPANGYHPNLWPAGQTMPDRHLIATDAALAPGKYSLEVGVFHAASGSRLAAFAGDAQLPDDRVVLGPLKVSPTWPVATPEHTLGAQFGGSVRLEGYSLDLASVRLGENVRLSLIWRVLQPMAHDYTIFVHLLDAGGKVVAQADHQAMNGRYPTSIWEAGERVPDDVEIRIPDGIPAGTYRIAVGLYDVETMARLSLQGQSDDRLILDTPIQIDVR